MRADKIPARIVHNSSVINQHRYFGLKLSVFVIRNGFIKPDRRKKNSLSPGKVSKLQERQVTVDTGRFTPVAGTGGLCAGSVARMWEVASPYYTYNWRRPNGTFFTGDTLVINPVLPTDTGIYRITKIININGCLDSVSGIYHLGFRDTFQQAVTICQGTGLYVGNSFHTISGTYRDTLTGAYGCDSIVITQLRV